jgi:membrane protein implicated in regulation of membrane protease activity
MGLVLAASFAGGAVIHVAADGAYPLETMMLAAASALLAWLTGRGLRFVLTSKPRDVAP